MTQDKLLEQLKALDQAFYALKRINDQQKKFNSLLTIRLSKNRKFKFKKALINQKLHK